MASIGNIEIYGYIYKITNRINGKIYIGQTINGFDNRYRCGNVEKYTHNIHLKKSIDKYGIENFEICKIFDIAWSKEELDIKEKCWISIYNCTNKNYGYNISDGGSNGNNFKGKTDEEMKIICEKISKANSGENNYMYGKHHSEKTKEKLRLLNIGKTASDETKKKMSEKRKGKNHPLYGKHHTDESKQKISKANSGENNPMYNKHHSEKTKEKLRLLNIGKTASDETKKKMSEKRKGKNAPFYGKHHSDEAKRKNSEAHSGSKNANSKKVICLTTGKIFGSAREGGKYYKCSHSGIIKCCKGENYKSCGKLEDGTKLVWSYYYDENEVIA